MAANVRRAFVLGAGLGTRLRPLSSARPKPLLPIFGKPLISFALDHLAAAGVESFVINTHHRADQFAACFPGGRHDGRPVELVFEPVLLETGGGIKNVEGLLGNEPFIVYSGDILTDIDIEALVCEHFERGNDVTLALRDTGLAASLALEEGRIVAIQPGRAGCHDYANVSVWNPVAFRRFRAGEKISFIPVLAEWVREGGKIGGLVLNDRGWFNVGSRAEYLAVHRIIAENAWFPAYLRGSSWPVNVAADAEVSGEARLRGFCAIGSGCVLEAGAVVENSILWEGAVIRESSYLRDCVVAGSLVISGRHENVDLTPSE